MGEQLVVPVRSAVLIRGGQMVGMRVDLNGHAGLLPPCVDRGDERAVRVEELRIEYRPRQAGTQDQVAEVGLGHRADAVADLGKRLSQQRGPR